MTRAPARARTYSSLLEPRVIEAQTKVVGAVRGLGLREAEMRTVMAGRCR
jgi:hypothetical protein